MFPSGLTEPEKAVQVTCSVQQSFRAIHEEGHLSGDVIEVLVAKVFFLFPPFPPALPPSPLPPPMSQVLYIFCLHYQALTLMNGRFPLVFNLRTVRPL